MSHNARRGTEPPQFAPLKVHPTLSRNKAPNGQGKLVKFDGQFSLFLPQNPRSMGYEGHGVYGVAFGRGGGREARGKDRSGYETFALHAAIH